MIHNKIFTGLFILFISASVFSCNKKSYPCPGLGQSNAADLSMFDESGQLKSKKSKKKKAGRIDKGTGLVNKSNPKQIRKKRKTRL